MSLKKIIPLLLVIAVIILTGCDKKPDKAAVTGLIDHSHWMTLSDGTLVIVRIEDTTREGAPGKKIAESVIKSHGDTIPMPFAVVYDPGKINDKHKYSVSVKIEDSSGNILYTNESNVPVITQGNPTRDIDVVVVLADK